MESGVQWAKPLMLAGLLLAGLLLQISVEGASASPLMQGLADPTIDKAFAPNTITVGGTSALTFTLANPNGGSGLTDLNFTDALPSGVEIAAAPNLGGTCGAVATNFTPNIAAGVTAINLISGVDLAASSSCTITVDVTGTSSGSKNNTTGNLGSTETGAGSDNASATLTVNNPVLTITVVGTSGADSIDSTGGTPSPGQISCPGGGVCAATFQHNDNVTLNVTVDASSSFQSWSGDCAAFGAALSGVITVDGDKSCTATFSVPAGTSSTTYVSDGGSDSNDCASLDEACATIQEAIDKVVAGGSVYVMGCEFPGGIAINKSVNLIHDPGDHPNSCGVIDAGGGPGITIGASNVTVSGFTFQDFSAGATAGIVINSGANVVIRDNSFIGPGSNAGIHRNGGTVNAEYNWFGCSAGPNTAACTNATGGVDRDPWLTEPPGASAFLVFNPSAEVTASNFLIFQVRFGICVQNVSTDDFTVTGGSTAVVSHVSQVSNCGCLYEVTVSGGDLESFTGEVGLGLAAGHDIEDTRGNTLPAYGPEINENYYHTAIEPSVREYDVGAEGGLFRLGRNVVVIIHAGALDDQDGSCRLIIAQVAESNAEHGFENDELLFEIRLRCNGSLVNYLNAPATICLRPQEGDLSSHRVYRQHDGVFQGLALEEFLADMVCGNTSLFSLFTLGEVWLPSTGFAPGEVLALPELASGVAYASTAMVLEIPTLGVELPIVGVPLGPGGWDTGWLNGQAGWLETTAFPTLEGNSVLTAHVWDANNQPGPFALLHELQHGDQFSIHAWGLEYVYEVRRSRLVSNWNLSVLRETELDWVTLLTCEGFDEFSGGYLHRRAVQAVVVAID